MAGLMADREREHQECHEKNHSKVVCCDILPHAVHEPNHIQLAEAEKLANAVGHVWRTVNGTEEGNFDRSMMMSMVKSVYDPVNLTTLTFVLYVNCYFNDDQIIVAAVLKMPLADIAARGAQKLHF